MPTRKESLDQWATRILLHAHAIAPCVDCGFVRLKFDQRAIDFAHALAAHKPYPGTSKARSVNAVDAVLDSLGDECPYCD